MHMLPFTEAVGDRKYFLCISTRLKIILFLFWNRKNEILKTISKIRVCSGETQSEGSAGTVWSLLYSQYVVVVVVIVFVVVVDGVELLDKAFVVEMVVVLLVLVSILWRDRREGWVWWLRGEAFTKSNTCCSNSVIWWSTALILRMLSAIKMI